MSIINLKRLILKHTRVHNRIPTEQQLMLGEIALNTYDGNMYFKKSNISGNTIVSVLTSNNTIELVNKTINFSKNNLIITKNQLNSAVQDGTPLYVNDTLSWSNIISTPNTIVGYGITDALSLNLSQSIYNKMIDFSNNIVLTTKNQLNNAITDGDLIYVGDTITSSQIQDSGIFGRLLLSSNNIIDARSSLQRQDFLLRASFVTWAATSSAAIGLIMRAANCTYVYIGSGTAIADLAGWIPFGIVTPQHFGALANGASSDQAACSDALAYSLDVLFPPGIYGLTTALPIRSGGRVRGSGYDQTSIIMLASAQTTTAGFLIASDDCIVEELRIDGNKVGRVTATTGSGVNVSGSRNTIKHCEIINWPNAGIIAGGVSATCLSNNFLNNRMFYNDGVGLSQYNVKNSKILNNRFGSNGLENLTIDVGSHACIVSGNHFFKHFGGCGNIGWDASDNCIFSNNFIDSENDTTAGVANRNGICFNGFAGTNNNSNISNNIIINCTYAGILFRNATYPAGQAAITGNSFLHNGVDAQLDSLSAKTKLRGNIYGSNTAFSSISTSSSLISLDTSDINWSTRLSSNTSLAVSSTFVDMTEDSTLNVYNCSLANNKITIPIGGLYHIDGKIRVTGINAAGVTGIGMSIVTPSGVRIANEPVVSGSDYCEVQLDWTVRTMPGDIYLQVRCFGGTPGVGGTIPPVTLSGGIENHFTGTYLA